MMKKPELLAPAGDFEKLKFALLYGADAVYGSGKNFSLRQFSKNFTDDELFKAIDYTHKLGKKFYLTINIYARNRDIETIAGFMEKFNGYPDAFIIADPGLVLLAKEVAPDTPIHLSTQANTTNFMAVKFWEKLGVKRINLARELTRDEIREIRDKTSMELEVFLHGAVCMSYSGRCFLSLYLTGRDGNRGECTQPCRWEYFLLEKKRGEVLFSIKQDSRGTYFFNTKDIALLEYIPDLLQLGVDSLKIEGRTKNINYVATVTRVYREAIDSYLENPEKWEIKGKWLEEIGHVSNRPYSSGFFPGNQQDTLIEMEKNARFKYRFAGILKKWRSEGYAEIDPRFTVYKNETVHFFSPDGRSGEIQVEKILDPDEMVEVPKSYPGKTFLWQLNEKLPERTIFRIRNRIKNASTEEKVLY